MAKYRWKQYLAEKTSARIAFIFLIMYMIDFFWKEKFTDVSDFLKKINIFFSSP